MERTPRAWVFLTLGEGRQYGGNLGYQDDPTTVYRYDSFVPNHLQVREGDLVVVRDRETILGSAVVERIEAAPSEKTRLSCPECDTTAIKERQTLTPRYRCNRGHVFGEPRSSSVTCTSYAASYPTTFVPARDLLAPDALRPAEIQSSDQLSIRAIDPTRLPAAARDVLGIPATHPAPYASAANPTGIPIAFGNLPDYETLASDTRAVVIRAIRARQGRAQFRGSLRQRYGDACMITGCSTIDVVEAAHISPYRGTTDNHPDNGLLLRADLHTLFDLDLLALDPISLVVHVHPRVRDRGYGEIEGLVLRTGDRGRPSEKALRERWVRYVASLPPRGSRDST